MSMDSHFKSEAANIAHLLPGLPDIIPSMDNCHTRRINLDQLNTSANNSIPEAIYVVQIFLDHRANTAKFEAFYDEKLALACVAKAVEEGKLALLSRCIVTTK